MNYAKAQKEVVAELLKGNVNMRWFRVDENSVSVVIDGYRAHIFPVVSIVFSVDKIREMTKLPVSEVVKDENELFVTKDLRVMDSTRKTIAIRLKGSGRNVFVNTRYLECYQNPRFYQGEANDPVIVTERVRGTNNIPVGIVLPYRCAWDDGTYYGDARGDI